jgi:hypothetical protein
MPRNMAFSASRRSFSLDLAATATAQPFSCEVDKHHMNEATALFLDLALGAIAAALSARILRERMKEGTAGLLGLGTHLAVAYAVNVTLRVPPAIPLAAGLVAAIGAAFVVRAIVDAKPR